MQVNVNRVLIIPLLFLFGCTTGGPWLKQSDTKSWSIQKQSEIVRSGKTAYRFEVRPGDGWGDGFKKSSRAEFSEKWNAPFNHETWYGMSIFIPKDIQPILKRLVIGQWHGTSHMVDKVEVWCDRPSVLSNELHLTQTFQIIVRYETEKRCAPNSYDPTSHVKRKHFTLSKFSLGVWNDLIYQVRWSTKKEGYLNVWLNGEKVVEYKGPIGFFDPKGPYFKYGIYRYKSEYNTHIVYFDSYRRGSSYKDVDPAQE